MNKEATGCSRRQFFLLFGLLLVLIIGARGSGRANTFSDTSDSYARFEIETLASQGMIRGYHDGSFRPADNATRAEFAVMLARVLGLPDDRTGAVLFLDVPNGAWYGGAVGVLLKAGIVHGTSDRSFSPDDYITRQEAIAMIIQAFGLSGVSIKFDLAAAYSDAGQISCWAKEPVGFATTIGLTAGTPDGKGGKRFEPKSIVQRQAIALWLHKLLTSKDYYSRKALELSDVPVFQEVIPVGEAKGAGGVYGAENCGDAAIVALQSYPVSVCSGSGGQAYQSAGPTDPVYGDEIEVKAIADPGYVFDCWDFADTLPGSYEVLDGGKLKSDLLTFNIKGRVKVKACFQLLPLEAACNLKAVDEDTAGIKVDGRDFSIRWRPSPSLGVDRQEIYILPSVLTLEPAVQTPVAAFIDQATNTWQGDSSLIKDSAGKELGRGSYSIYLVTIRNQAIMYSQAEMTAIPEHRLVLGIEDTQQGLVVADGGIESIVLSEGSSIGITAIPNPGWMFEIWTLAPSGTGALIESLASANSKLTMGGDDVAVSAVFSFRKCTLNITVLPAEAGSVSDGSQTIMSKQYDYGSSVTLLPAAASGYVFSNWEVDGENQSTNPLVITLTKDICNVNANFDRLSLYRLHGCIYGLAREGTLVQIFQDAILRAQGVSDPSGKYNLEGLPPGDYSVIYSHEEYRTSTYAGVSVSADLELNVTLYAGAGSQKADLDGWVSRNGVRINGLQVKAQDGLGHTLSATTSTYKKYPGHYEFNNLEVLGNYTVEVSIGENTLGQSIWVDAGDNRLDLNMTT